MTCPQCGDVCICVSDVRPSAFNGMDTGVEDRDRAVLCRAPSSIDRVGVSRPTVDFDEGSPRPIFVVGDKDESVEPCAPRHDARSTSAHLTPVPESSGSNPIPSRGMQADLVADSNDWREEVSARLNRYRARRSPRAPRYPSLRLKFAAPESHWAPSSRASEAPSLLAREPEMQAPSTSALAPEPLLPAIKAEPVQRPGTPPHEPAGKIIEFPKWTYTPNVRYSDLAESVIDRPRILEAPEIEPPPPALGGITIEEKQEREPERRPGIDMPLQCARLGYRWLAVVLDAAVVLLAGGIFGTFYYQIAGAQPTVRQVMVLTMGALPFFWFAYQYLLIVYSGTTLGLRAMKLQLQCFDGSTTHRRLRRWRVLGSVLSAVSLGMGYAWQFLDEDALCWHERVTKTYLAPEKQT